MEAKPIETFEMVWRFDLENDLISIGWSELGDVSKMGREELGTAVRQAFPLKPSATQSLIANMFWVFFHENNPGDVILARRGRKVLAAIGRVSGPGVYAPGKNPNHGHRNFLTVSWQQQPRWLDLPAPTY